jgi:CHASE2 domain-containing sensor protein
VALFGGAWCAAALLLWISGAFNLRDNIRELTFDQLLPLLASRPAQSPVVVVDIDRDKMRSRVGPIGCPLLLR